MSDITANRPDQPTFLQLALSGGTPRRACLTALVVGTVLTLINHLDLMLSGTAPPVGKVLLTFCVPYCVATWGAVGAKRAALRSGS